MTEASTGCVAPELGTLWSAYCYGDLSDEPRERFSEHLLACSYCWQRVERLERAIDTLRQHREEWRPGVMRDVQRLTGPSSRFNGRLNGHRGFAVLASVLYGALAGSATVLEFVYSYEAIGPRGLAWSALVGALSGVAVFALLRVSAQREAEAGPRVPALLAGGLTIVTALAAMSGIWLLPARPLVSATFLTYPATLGVVKTLFWTLLASLTLLPYPFLLVVALERELHAGRHRGVWMVVSRHPLGLPPRGRFMIPPAALAGVAAALVVLDFVGMAHLLEALRPGPHAGAFSMVRWSRFVLAALFNASVVLWYTRAIDAIRREAAAAVVGPSRGSGDEEGPAPDGIEPRGHLSGS